MSYRFPDRDTLDTLYGKSPDAIIVERFDAPIADNPESRQAEQIGDSSIVYLNPAFQRALAKRGYTGADRAESPDLFKFLGELVDDSFKDRWRNRHRQGINNLRLGAHSPTKSGTELMPLMMTITPIVHDGMVYGCSTRVTDASLALNHNASEQRALRQIDAFVRTENVPLLCLAFTSPLSESVTAGELGQAYFDASITHITDSAAALFKSSPAAMLHTPLTVLNNPGVSRLIRNAFPTSSINEPLNLGDTPELMVEVNTEEHLVYRVKPTFIFEEGKAVEAWMRIEDITHTELLAREQKALEQARELALAAASLHQYDVDLANNEVKFDPDVAKSMSLSCVPTTVDGWLDLLKPEDLNISSQEIADILSGKARNLNFVLRVTNDEGEDSFLEVWGIVNATNGANTKGRTLGLFRDVTINEKLSARLREKKTLEGLGVLAGGVAHDFNNLLMSVLGYAELMEADMLEAPPRDPALLQQSALQNIEEIRSAALRASELCASLLAYAGQHMIEKKTLDLTELVRSTTELIDLTVAKRVPLLQILDTEVQIAADKGQLTQVIINLVGNAADAMEGYEGAVYLSVTTELLSSEEQALLPDHIEAPDSRFACLTVRDEGCGMSAETLQRMYEPFFTTKADGRGLGMAAVHGIVKHHGGVILVRSAPDEGTEFRVCLPLLARLPTAEHAIVSAPPQTRPKQPRVLVVDDEPGVRTIAAEMLRHLNCTVQEAESAEAALALFANHTFDYALLDITMPVMSGTELAELLLERVPDLQVVLCSGYTERDVPDELLARCAFIHKPYTLSEVSAILQLEGTDNESAISA